MISRSGDVELVKASETLTTRKFRATWSTIDLDLAIDGNEISWRQL